MKIALVAEEAAGAHALKRCIASSHTVDLLLSAGAQRPEGASSLGGIARDGGVEVGDPSLVRSAAFGAELAKRDIDVLLNVHSLFLIHPDVLSAPRLGSFNLHPGSLPEYAGINTVSWALFERAAEYGSTLHWLTRGIDAGPIAYAARFPIDEGMTAARLMGRSVREGLVLIDRLLEQLTRDPGGIPSLPQTLDQRRYYDRSIPAKGRIEWSRQDAREIDALVRACDYDPYTSPWGRAQAQLGGVDVLVTRVALTGEKSTQAPGAVGHRTTRGVQVAARDEWIEVLRAEVRGKSVHGRELMDHIATIAAS